MSYKTPNSGQDIHLGGRKIVHLSSEYVLNLVCLDPTTRVRVVAMMVTSGWILPGRNKASQAVLLIHTPYFAAPCMFTSLKSGLPKYTGTTHYNIP